MDQTLQLTLVSQKKDFITLTIMNRLVSSYFNYKHSSEAGFSLLELAIVLVILGTIGSLGIPLLTTHMTRTAVIKTRTHQEYVLNAIAVYVEKHKRFPCPAAPHLLGAHFGLALKSCRMEEAKGIIPFKTLGISEIYARDGFKRFMTYVIEPELTKTQINPVEESGGFITIKNEEGYPVLEAYNKTEKNQNYIALVIISHGESGVGAYRGNGQGGKISGHSLTPKKGENSNDGFVFIENRQSDVILRWETRDQFLKHFVRFIK